MRRGIVIILLALAAGSMRASAVVFGSICLETNLLSYTSYGNGTSNATLIISNSGPGSFTFTASLAYDQSGESGWASVAPTGGALAAGAALKLTNTVTVASGHPVAPGVYYATCVVASASAGNSPQEYTLQLTANNSYNISPSHGPLAGGHGVTVTNTAQAIGDGLDITNVALGAVGTTNIVGQGSNWVSFVAPATGSAGAKDIVVQSASLGATTFAGAYTVNPAGQITAVSPSSGSHAGGYPVSVSGSNLGAGGDITNVTLCGVSTTNFVSQSATQVIVTAGATLVPGLGDVLVQSESFGVSVRSNAFTYAVPGLRVIGVNGETIESGAGALLEKGNAFGSVAIGAALTHTFSITNNGTEVLSILSWATHGLDPSVFQVSGFPSQVSIGGVSNFTVIFAPLTLGRFSASLTLSNDSPTASYVLNFSGSAFSVSTNVGPFGGGNTITLGVLGGNGVYAYGAGSVFPNQSYSNANYWVDALFQTGAPPASTTIWPTGATPTTADIGPESAAELGVKFRSDVAGSIAGIRFYKSAANTGVHVGNLWSSAGELLASAVFTNETASGWQEALFAAPAAIDSNTIYVASYHANDGHYSVDLNYFDGTGADTPPLRALAADTTFGAGNVTNVLVGGVAATIAGQGVGWLTITLPAATHAGAANLVVQTSDRGDITLAGAYTYNPAGVIPDAFSRAGLPSLITLTDSWLDGRTNGVILAGAKDWSYSGWSVSSAGDVNGDGCADLLVGAKQAGPGGEAYLVYGRSNGLPAWITLTNTWLDGANGVLLAAAGAQDNSGWSVSSAGDVNGDGCADLLVGAPYADPSGRGGAGETYLVYGRSNGLPALITLSSGWLDGNNGVILAGAQANANSGCSVSSAGDVNGDGYADLLVGAYQANSGAGETYLVYGRSNGLPALITLSSGWLDGNNGVILAGAQANANSGYSVSSAGDVNGDGYADLLVGAYQANSGAGETYLVYGRTNLPAWITLTNTWLEGTNGVILAGAVVDDNSGISVSSAGDVNHDGYADVLVGAYHEAMMFESSKPGRTYLVYGRTNLPAWITLTNSWLNGNNGVIFVGAQENDRSGCSVSGAGDVNRDGYADLLVGASGADPASSTDAGETCLVYGRTNLPAWITLTNTWLDGNNGVLLAGGQTNDTSGWSVSSAGDVNHDGYADLLVGAQWSSPSGRVHAGKTYLVYGRSGVCFTPVEPSFGSWTGGYPVVIIGTNLGNGADITNVTICGVTALLGDQTATSVVVTAGAAAAVGLGDVRIYSTSYGETVKSNAFMYTGAGMAVLGANGAVIDSGSGVSPLEGTQFRPTLLGTALTNTFSITNSGTETLNILSWATNGIQNSEFRIQNIPPTVSVGGVSNFTVVYAPASVGDHAALLVLSNNAPTPTYTVNLAGSCYAISTNIGPYAGGNTITITNGTLGDGADITNVLVGGVAATIAGQGAGWLTITLPAATNAGAVDIVVQTSDRGDTTLANAYTYHVQGQIGSDNPWDWSAWEDMGVLPCRWRSGAAVVFSNKIYLVGGQVNSFITNMVYSYNGANWIQEPSLPRAASDVGAAVFSNRLYVVGGRPTGITNVYWFDGANWSAAAGLPQGRAQLASAVIGDYLYAYGGQSSGAAKTNVYRFNGAVWTETKGFPIAIGDQGAAPLNGYVYSIGGYCNGSAPNNALTNVFRHDGTNLVEMSGLPIGLRYPRAATLSNGLYSMGGCTTNMIIAANVYRYDGANWSVGVNLPGPRYYHAAVTYQDQIYCIGGDSDSGNISNVFRYPARVDTNGVMPAAGSWSGGYTVAISGANLGNGADITNVTICDVRATISSQTASRVWVRAGVAVSAGAGDVVVQSVSYGETVKSNAFTYTGAGMAVLGTNGAVIGSGAAVSALNGTDFRPTLVGAALTNTFSITNSGTAALTIRAVETNGSQGSEFRVQNLPSVISVSSVAQFQAVFTPSAVGSPTCALQMVSDAVGANSNYYVNLRGHAYALSTNIGPYAGGNTLTLTNGNFGTVTNVLVGGLKATVQASGVNWVRTRFRRRARRASRTLSSKPPATATSRSPARIRSIRRGI